MVNLVDAFSTELEVVDTFDRETTTAAIHIRLSDGVELAAQMWIPIDAEAQPVPAIVEYIPYRQRDYTALRDGLIHPWFAGHGYAAIRVDMRGSGDSDGVPMDEYVQQEQDDALEVLAWIRDQSWCTGATGMMGISWGGFNALQVAARRPPGLKAIVTVCSTDNRYTDDVHYPGGCLVSDNLTWGALGFANMARAPDPAVVGDRWREMWLERLRNSPMPLATWLSHQRRDDYWKHGSVCENYADIECAVFAVGGWADSYSNAALRLVEHLPGAKRARVGPWGHAYPHLASPGPRIGFLEEATRWWDRWLKGVDNGIDAEPPIDVWVQEPVPPRAAYESRPGFWLQLPSWPATETRVESYTLNPGSLSQEAGNPATLRICSPVTTGATFGEWMPLGAGPEQPLDQRLDAGGMLTFDSAPLDEPVTLLGSAVTRLSIRSDSASALLSVWLCDIAPSSEVTVVTHGLLNLNHRESHEYPTPLEPGTTYSVRVRLNDIAQIIPAGHRIRLCVATAHWPLAWPSAGQATIEIDTAECRLDLPLRTGCSPESVVAPAPAIPTPPAITWLRSVEHRRVIERDMVNRRTTLSYFRDEGAFEIDAHGGQVDSRGVEQHRITHGEPLSASGRIRWRLELGRGEWQTAVECVVTQTATAQSFLLSVHLEAFEGELPVFTRSQSWEIPRDLV